MNKPEKSEAFDDQISEGKGTVDEEISENAVTGPEKSAEETAEAIVEEKEIKGSEKKEKRDEKKPAETGAKKPAEKNAKKPSAPSKNAKNIKSLYEGTPKKKHKKLKIFLIIVLILIIGAVGTVVYNIILNKDFTVTFYQIRSDKVSDNIRIVELADLHSKEYGTKNKKLVETIKNLKPDLIFYAGDMMNYKVDDYSVLFDLSDKLSEIAPIYACYGNNELSQYLFRDREFYDKLTEHNVILLSNEALEVEVGKTTIQLIAITDNVDEFDVETNNSKKFLENLGSTDKLRICLTHYPELFVSKLLDRGIDIAFTGHAHGGLIRIPKIGGLYSNGEGFLPKLTSGVMEMKDGTKVVISRGLGDSSSIPRINNQPELVVVDICWY